MTKERTKVTAENIEPIIKFSPQQAWVNKPQVEQSVSVKKLQSAWEGLQVAHWVQAITNTTPISFTIGFQAKMIVVDACAAISWWSNQYWWSHSHWSYDVANDTNRSVRLEELENNHSDTWTPATQNSTSTLYNCRTETNSTGLTWWWTVTDVDTTSFEITAWNAWLDVNIRWIAYW